MLLSGSIAFAQSSPTVMTIGEHPVSKAEFEQYYHRNLPVDGEGKTTVSEFAGKFVDFKLKVYAALDAHLDSSVSFKAYADDDEACRASDQEMLVGDGLASGCRIKASHILLRLGQRVPFYGQEVLRKRADSIYAALRQGADFAEMARKYSDDVESAKKGGVLPWIAKGQTLKSFEDVVFSMKEGEMSKPFLTELGYHIVKLSDKRDDGFCDSLKRSHSTLGVPQWLRDELLVNEIYRLTIAEKASGDERGLEAYYAKNKKKYKRVLSLLKKKAKKKQAVGLDNIRNLVLADYQDLLEQQWVSQLRKKYRVVVFPDVLATIYNKR